MSMIVAPQIEIKFSSIEKALGQPLFVKPANLGSSVGISKVKSRTELEAAVKKAFRFDNKILIEEFIEGREIECSVLGNDDPIASLPGEIVTGHDFYSYDAKYIDDQGSRLEIPAKLPRATVKSVQEIAITTYRTLCCEGMARVDFFVENGRSGSGQRDQHDPRFHTNQYVSEDVGSKRDSLPQADRPAHPTCSADVSGRSNVFEPASR